MPPRIGYKGEGNNLRRLLNNSPDVAAAYRSVRKALSEGVLSPKLRLLSFLASDIVNKCRY